MDITCFNHLYSSLSNFCPGDFFNLTALIRDKCVQQHYNNVLFNPCTRIVLAAAIAAVIDATG
jgi:hypothetical protein